MPGQTEGMRRLLSCLAGGGALGFLGRRRYPIWQARLGGDFFTVSKTTVRRAFERATSRTSAVRRG